MNDPARAVLAKILDLTVAKNRFPGEEDFLRRNPKSKEVVRRLLDDGRYLARAIAGDAQERFPTRLAVCVRGLYEAETPLGQSETEGVVRTRERLVGAIHRNVFEGRVIAMRTLHQKVASDLEYEAFRRWTTLLGSPRLQGRYVGDPIGFYGQSDAFGVPGDKTGLLVRVYFTHAFSSWEGLPKREERRTFLFPEDGLRVRVDDHGQVHVLYGGDEVIVLPGSIGSLVFAALVSRPGRATHSLDLQAESTGFPVLEEGYAYDPGDVKNRLEDFDIPHDSSTQSPVVAARMAAVVRRLEILEYLEDAEQPLPKWADGDAGRRKQALLDDLRANLVSGPLRADHPLVKNAKKVVKRALEDVLARPPLARFRSAFEVGEFFTYRPVT